MTKIKIQLLTKIKIQLMTKITMQLMTRITVKLLTKTTVVKSVVVLLSSGHLLSSEVKSTERTKLLMNPWELLGRLERK
jgi:hypothetical protein